MMIGAIAVVLFMLIYYGWLGSSRIWPWCSHAVHGGHLAAFEASLTLPGIRGWCHHRYGVGPNIIIYERIRESLPRQVAAHGGRCRSSAVWTVFDAHVTNFVAGIVLYSYGSGHPRFQSPCWGHRVQFAHLGVDLAVDVDLIVGPAGRFRDPFHLAGRRITMGRIRNFRYHQTRINLESLATRNYWIGAVHHPAAGHLLMLPSTLRHQESWPRLTGR